MTGLAKSLLDECTDFVSRALLPVRSPMRGKRSHL